MNGANDTYLGMPLEFWFTGPLGIPFHIWSLAVTLTGLMVGSFLNVVIHRMPLNQSVITPPSHCPKCDAKIPLRHNLPVVSWLWLRGRCANCAAPISPRYLAVEVLTGAVFLATWLTFGRAEPLMAAALCALFAGFIAATFIDFEHLIIPDEITLGGIVAGFLFSAASPALQGAANAPAALRASALGILVGGGLVYGILRLGKLLFGRQKVALEPGTRVLFHEAGLVLPTGEIPYEELFYRKSDAVVFHARRIELADRCYANQTVRLELRREPPALRIGDETFDADDEPWMAAETDAISLPREAMGFGDVKFMAAIGAFLGWPATLFSLLASSLLGTGVALVLILLRRQKWSGRLGYGPYLAAAAMLWVFGGRTLVRAWWGH